MGGAYKWPTFAAVMDYRQKVREMVIGVIETVPLSHPITMDNPWVSIAPPTLINHALILIN